MPVSVRWGSDRFEFELPAPDTLLAAVRASIAHALALPPAAFQLVHDGAVLADDNAPISAYHIRPNSTLTVVETNVQPQIAPIRGDGPSENVQIAAIRAELAAVNSTLVPAHAAFLRQPSQKEHARIAELLLQALLRIDGLVPHHDWHTARADRKAAVKFLQALLDQLDAKWADAR